jgi:hypothetical protein
MERPDFPRLNGEHSPRRTPTEKFAACAVTPIRLR